MAEKKIDNSAFLEAQKKMRADYNNKTQSDLINIALHSTFIVPALIDNKTRIVANENNEVKFDDTPQAKFQLVDHPKLGTYIPVFTDDEEFKKFVTDEKIKKIAMGFPQVAQLVEQVKTANGFVVNPGGDALPFSKQLLDDILQQLLKAQEDMKAQEEKANN